MKHAKQWLSAGLVLGIGLGNAAGQAAGQPAVPKPAVTKAARTPPLQLRSLDPATKADPFPPVDPKFFTATSPTLATVDSYLRALLGFDAGRIWRVESIATTPAPGVSKVVVYLSDRSANAKVQTAVFMVTPDGKHAIADGAVVPFGAKPFEETRMMLAERATGPFRGAAAKDLELVEFTDLQCPHCREAEAVMKRLAEDFPKAHIVQQSFPLTDLHPFAAQAAAYGVCAAKTGNAAYFSYAQAVYDMQASLTTEAGETTLKAAATKAGLDPEATAACAAGSAAKGDVDASAKLAREVGVVETPTLVVNGRLLPLSVPYETLKSIIIFQAGLDGVSAAATMPEGRGLIGK